MKKEILLTVFAVIQVLMGCNRNNVSFDASGNFEAEEVIVSSEVNGKILSFPVEEGQQLIKGQVAGYVDAKNISLQKEQVEETINALQEKTTIVAPQVKLLEEQLAVQQSQLKSLQRERLRTENLVRQDAATGKQLDDINAQVEVLVRQMAVTQQQISVQKSNSSVQNKGILSEAKPLQKRIAQLDDQLAHANIINPINGMVLTKYAREGEITSAGKALYKIADLSVLTLRAYISGSQLTAVKPGQQVKVFVDNGAKGYRELPGTITWIADKAEFTPKTIQTKDERANLVYAVKIKVKNDGYLRIGMYAEIKLIA